MLNDPDLKSITEMISERIEILLRKTPIEGLDLESIDYLLGLPISAVMRSDLEEKRALMQEQERRRQQIEPAQRQAEAMGEEVWQRFIAFREYLFQGELREARIRLEEILKIEPNLDEIRTLKNSLEREIKEALPRIYNEGLSHYRAGDYELAQRDFTKACKLNPGYREGSNKPAQELLDEVGQILERRKEQARLFEETADRERRRAQLNAKREERETREAAQREAEIVGVAAQEETQRQQREEKLLHFINTGEGWSEIKSYIKEFIVVDASGIRIAGNAINELIEKGKIRHILKIIFYYYGLATTSSKERELIISHIATLIREERKLLEEIIGYTSQEPEPKEINAQQKILKELARTNKDNFEELIKDKELKPELEVLILKFIVNLGISSRNPDLLITYLEVRRARLINESTRNQFVLELGYSLKIASVFAKVVQILSQEKIFSSDAASFLKISDISEEELKLRMFSEAVIDKPDLIWDSLLVCDAYAPREFVNIMNSLVDSVTAEPRRFPDGAKDIANALYTPVLDMVDFKIHKAIDSQGNLPFENVMGFLSLLFQESYIALRTLCVHYIPRTMHLAFPLDRGSMSIVELLSRFLPAPGTLPQAIQSVKSREARRLLLIDLEAIYPVLENFRLTLEEMKAFAALDQEGLLDKLKDENPVVRRAAQFSLTKLWARELEELQASQSDTQAKIQELLGDFDQADELTEGWILEALIDIATSDTDYGWQLTKILLDKLSRAYIEVAKAEEKRIKPAVKLRYLIDKSSLRREREIDSLLKDLPEDAKEISDVSRGLTDIFKEDEVLRGLNIAKSQLPRFVLRVVALRPTMYYWQSIEGR
ncbi:MAG: hypothetical protein A2166_06785 [Omnitrophica WOR_2 bacterium RBG_13_41_10]|nr:MAG: hypothetical protein A2166_06785 [Omnitrophica WOR_2 bacterium RBG_13_41_10]